MKIARKGLLAGLAILWVFSVCLAVEPASISGFYYQDDLSKPLPGALVVLYKTDDNTLVDYTYTRENGAFTLKGPAAKGKYYVVATKDQFSKKVDLDYDPQAGQNLFIQHHQPKSTFRKFRDWVGTRFDDVIKVLIGLFLGLGFKIYEDRRKANQTVTREIQGIKESSEVIVSKGQDLRKIAEAYGQSAMETSASKRAEFVELAKTIDTQVDELKKQLDAKSTLDEAIYSAHKMKGRNDYAAFRNALKEIKKLTETIVASPGTVLNAPDRDTQLRLFQTLQDNNFLKNY